jgi:predicted exporter
MSPLPKGVRFLLRHPRRVLAICVVLTLAALVPALRFRIDTDLANLLPDGAPGSEDYRLFLRTFGGFEKVFVIVRPSGPPPEDTGPLVDAAGRLAEALQGSPEVAEARSGITAEDEAFFLRHVAPRLPLLLDGDVRAELAPRLEPSAIHLRVAEMRQSLRSPLGAATAPLLTADPLGLSAGLLEEASAALPVDPLTGAFLARRGDAALVILTPARAELDPAGGRAFLAELEKAYARVRQESALPLDFEAVGGPIYAAQDEAILREDLTRTATASAAGVAILLLLGFGGGFIPLVILISVAAGLVWTAAATALGLGSISVIGVGFAAALVGMGVEYGIHAGARYRTSARQGGARKRPWWARSGTRGRGSSPPP